MKITLISDTHAKHNQLVTPNTIRSSMRPVDLPGGDLLIHAGDFMTSGYSPMEMCEFMDWFESIEGYDTKVFIAGNHDRIMQTDSEYARGVLTGYKTIDYLQDEQLTMYFMDLMEIFQKIMSEYMDHHGNLNFIIGLSIYQEKVLDWLLNGRQYQTILIS